MLDALSETVSKNRRGRPRTVPKHCLSSAKDVFNDITTSRGLTNKAFTVRAVGVLRPDGVSPQSAHAWFAGDGVNWRQGILVEIGRIAHLYGDQTALGVADRIGRDYGSNHTTREVAGFIRSRRLHHQGKAPKSTAEGLSDRLLTTLIDYLSDHPDVTARTIGDAVSQFCSNAETVCEKLP